MADEKLKFELVNPEGIVVSAEVDDVVVPGSGGYFMVLSGHAPFLSTLRPGVLRISGLGGETKDYFVRDGLADVSPSGLTILAQQAVEAQNMPANIIDTEIARMEEELKDIKDDALLDARKTELGYLTQTKEELAGQ